MVALALTASACGSTADTNSDSSGSDCDGKIGFFGALSGSNSSVVLPSRDGAKLALTQWSEENKDCKVELVEFDTEGDPAKATPVANKIASDDTFIGVMGGAFSGETRATKNTYNEAGVPMISASATATDLTTTDAVPVFHRVIGYDDVQGAAIARYLKDVAKATKVFVVDDSTAYGGPLGDKVKSELGDLVVGSDKVQEKQDQFDTTVTKVKGANPDAVFYAGYAAEAGPFLKQLRSGGVTATFVGGDGLYGADFPKAAGEQADGAIVTCPCLPADQAEGTFAEDFEAEFGAAPGAYAAEGFDAMNIFLAGIKDGKTDRESLQKFVSAYDAPGITKDLKFDDKGDIAEENVVIWSYKIEGGVLVPDQEIPKE
ncbi:MAG: branched-chain amino acid ABC transporter substrate-binding protein [Marmoricola sp.]